MNSQAATQQIEHWPIDRLVFYVRNPRKNDAAVDRMYSSIREFGFKIPVLARSDGEVVDGHLGLNGCGAAEASYLKHRSRSTPGVDGKSGSGIETLAFRIFRTIHTRSR
jgi:hypothetical protein